MCFSENFIKTKVSGHPQISGGRSPVWTPNPDLEGLGPSVLLELWCLTFKGSDKIKVVVYVLNRYPPNSAWPQGQANVWLY